LDAQGAVALLDHRVLADAHASERRVLTAMVRIGGECRQIEGRGTGAIDAFVSALNAAAGLTLAVADYHEHALGAGADANAVAYVEVRSAEGTSTFGVGLHKDIVTASLRAVVSAANRLAHARAATAAETIPSPSSG
jgi:2-isopropylmalate synthase